MDLNKHDDDKETSFVDLEKKQEQEKENENEKKVDNISTKENVYDENCYFQEKIDNTNSNTNYTYTETRNTYTNSNYNQVTDKYELIGLIFGILSIVCCCCGGFSLPLGVVGIVFSTMAKKNNSTLSNLGVAALICSIIGTILASMLLLYHIIGIITAGGVNGYIEDIEKNNQKNGISLSIMIRNFLTFFRF